MKAQDERNVVRLNKPLLACSLLLGAAMGLQATPVCPTTGNYGTLESLGSCTIGDTTFGDFTYGNSAIGAVPVTASALTYTTIDNGPSAIGFLFSVALTAPTGGANTIGLGYTVTGSNITDAGVTMAGVSVGGSGSSASIGETICPGNTIAACVSSLSLSTYVLSGGPSKSTDTATFSPVDTLGVLKGVTVVGGGGLAVIPLFSETVSESVVPEPGFYGVLAGGVGIVLMFARRRRGDVKA
jgi:hypothetical protein